MYKFPEGSTISSLNHVTCARQAFTIKSFSQPTEKSFYYKTFWTLIWKKNKRMKELQPTSQVNKWKATTFSGVFLLLLLFPETWHKSLRRTIHKVKAKTDDDDDDVSNYKKATESTNKLWEMAILALSRRERENINNIGSEHKCATVTRCSLCTIHNMEEQKYRYTQ